MSAGAGVILAQPQIGEGGFETLTNDPTAAKLDFMNAVRARRVGISQPVNYKGSQPWDRCESFPQPLEGKMARDHGKRDKGPSPRCDVQAGKGNQSLARAAFRDNRGRTGLGKSLHDATYCNSLGRVRPAEQLSEQRRRRIVRAL